MNKSLKTAKKVFFFAIIVILSLFLFIIGGISLIKYAIYPDYYSIKTDICKNPGLSDGFICQGICAYEEGGKILVSGYMKDHSPSRIYVTDTESNSYYVSVFYGSGKEFTGHSGGISVCGDNAYIASGEKIYQIPVASILNAENGAKVSISKIIPVNNQASFIYSDGEYLYVGEFHDGKNHITDHPYDTAEGRNFAIVSKYSKSTIEGYKKDAETPTPERVYSIRNSVQGICFTPDGKIVLSTSYGIASSVYYVYNESDAVLSENTLDGAPVYYLDKCERQFKGPSMSEGLDYYDGKVITLTESASDKYIFGKFFFADKIVGLEIK